MIHVWQMRWTGRAHAHSVGTINARADTLSWLCDERWWPCACLDDNSLKGTRINVFTFTVQHNNRCCKCVQTRTNAYIEKPAYTCLHVRQLTVCSWGQIEAKCIRNDTVLTRTRAAPGAATSSAIQGRAFWLKTSGIHQSISPFPSSSSRFRCMAVRLWHANKRLFLLLSPLQEKVESKMCSRASNGRVTMEHRARSLSLSLSLLPSLFLSFTHLVFLSQSPHSADVRRWQWEGLKGGMSCASVSPPADGTSARISVYVDVKLDALCSIPLSSLKIPMKTALRFNLWLYVENGTKTV